PVAILASAIYPQSLTRHRCSRRRKPPKRQTVHQTGSTPRHPTGLSQKGYTLLVLTTFASLRRVFEGFTFVRLSDAHLHEIDPALLPQCSPPRLFTAAAWSGLGSAPENRSRGANPHLSRSLSTRLVST